MRGAISVKGRPARARSKKQPFGDRLPVYLYIPVPLLSIHRLRPSTTRKHTLSHSNTLPRDLQHDGPKSFKPFTIHSFIHRLARLSNSCSSRGPRPCLWRSLARFFPPTHFLLSLASSTHSRGYKHGLSGFPIPKIQTGSINPPTSIERERGIAASLPEKEKNKANTDLNAKTKQELKE